KSAPVTAGTETTSAPTDEIHAGRMSTSKLGSRLGIKTAGETLTRLVAAGFLVFDGSSHRLTSAGIAAGAVYVEKSRYGPYFLWPDDIIL
ncbi:MAG: DNA repair protein, partial [Burkholderiaceae bacterium]|nr:DNA repair protein [Burkholderiaceae bacterium]